MKWLYLTLMALLLIPSQAQAEKPDKLLVMLVGDDNCALLEKFMQELPYWVACTGEQTLWQSMGQWQFLTEKGYKLVYVIDYRPHNPHGGTEYGIAFDDYALSVPIPTVIEHEGKHLEEGHCTTDGLHDRDYWCSR